MEDVRIEQVRNIVLQWRLAVQTGDTRGSMRALEDIERVVNAEPPPPDDDTVKL